MRVKFKYIILIFILCLCAVFILSSGFFSIKNIKVSGNKNVSEEAIIKLSDLKYGENIFRINKMRVIKTLFQEPRLKMINIRRSLPNTVIIDVIEREAIALVPYVGSYLNIDEEGIIIEISPSLKKSNLPIINGLKFDTFKLGEYLEIANKEQFDITKSIISEIKNTDLINEISTIDVSNIDNIQLTTVKGILLNMGSSKEIKGKMAFAKAIIEDVNKKQLKGTIDMSQDGNPVFKPQ